MIKPTRSPAPIPHDPRLYTDYAQLVRIQAYAHTLNLLPNSRIGSKLDGRHSSKLRGRGLNFEELRHYQIGDDIRNIDWKVTLRTGQPHVRGYTEEKDRHVIVCIDQRSSMFFASTNVMKSVVASEITALVGWRTLKESDRVSFLLMDDAQCRVNKATRSQSTLLAFFKTLARTNQALNAQGIARSQLSFSHFIDHLTRNKTHGSTIFIVSDWQDASPKDVDRLHQLQRSNDVIPVIITDPLEQQLPKNLIENTLHVGDGEYQFSLAHETQRQTINHALKRNFDDTSHQLTRLIATKGLPVVALSTQGDHIKLFGQYVGGNKK
ncbi:DUF58 domain-containing protein [Vibrio astriarenae]